jgi:hypothetical protein
MAGDRDRAHRSRDRRPDPADRFIDAASVAVTR